MKPVTLFYQPRCPFCKKALGYLEELQRQERLLGAQEYRTDREQAFGIPFSAKTAFRLSLVEGIEIRMIDELAEPEVADRYDYYYVPTFYVGDKKVHEGGIMPDEVEAVLRMALDER